MDNPPQDNEGLGQSTADDRSPVVPSPPILSGTEGFETNPPPLFLGDRSTTPPPFVLPSEPIPEEKLVPYRMILGVVSIFLVILVVTLWWFLRPKAPPPESVEVAKPPLIEEPSPTPVMPAEAEMPTVHPSPTISLAVSPTTTVEQATPTPSRVTRSSPTPIPTVPEASLPEAGDVGRTVFTMLSGAVVLLAGLLLLL